MNFLVWFPKAGAASTLIYLFMFDNKFFLCYWPNYLLKLSLYSSWPMITSANLSLFTYAFHHHFLPNYFIPDSNFILLLGFDIYLFYLYFFVWQSFYCLLSDQKIFSLLLYSIQNYFHIHFLDIDAEDHIF